MLLNTRGTKQTARSIPSQILQRCLRFVFTGPFTVVLFKASKLKIYLHGNTRFRRKSSNLRSTIRKIHVTVLTKMNRSVRLMEPFQYKLAWQVSESTVRKPFSKSTTDPLCTRLNDGVKKAKKYKNILSIISILLSGFSKHVLRNLSHQLCSRYY